MELFHSRVSSVSTEALFKKKDPYTCFPIHETEFSKENQGLLPVDLLCKIDSVLKSSKK